MKKVGIARALFYYYYYPLWKTFFQEMGAEVLLSRETNKLTIQNGIDLAVDETCFPVKVYYGHVQELCRQNIDYLFLPRVVSIEPRSYICPKFMGLPDMIKASMLDLPPVIDMVIDVSINNKMLKREIERIGKIFGRRQGNASAAYDHGLAELEKCRALSRQGFTLREAVKIWEGDPLPPLPGPFDLNIGLLGHGYSLYDPVISMNIVHTLREMGCRLYFPEMLEMEDIEREAATLPKRVFWTLGRKMVGSSLQMEKDPRIDGIIYLASFGCGPDSMIGETIERKMKDKVYMLLTVDEHTGEAGLHTRLEAFCDMLRRRRSISHESYLSSHG